MHNFTSGARKACDQQAARYYQLSSLRADVVDSGCVDGDYWGKKAEQADLQVSKRRHLPVSLSHTCWFCPDLSGVASKLGSTLGATMSDPTCHTFMPQEVSLLWGPVEQSCNGCCNKWGSSKDQVATVIHHNDLHLVARRPRTFLLSQLQHFLLLCCCLLLLLFICILF